MGASKTEALYKVGEYLLKDDVLYQVTHIHARQYTLKKWELAGWGPARRFGIKKLENNKEFDLISKYKAKKILAGKFGLFIKEVKALGISTEPYFYGCGYHSWETDKKPIEPMIGIQWSTGGVSGGSCWDTGDDDPHYHTSGEPEEELTQLDTILEHFSPNISFLQYKKLCQELIERGEHRENEYYGNYTDYAHKFIRLRRLYSYLNEKGWLPQHLVEE